MLLIQIKNEKKKRKNGIGKKKFQSLEFFRLFFFIIGIMMIEIIFKSNIIVCHMIMIMIRVFEDVLKFFVKLM